MELGWPIVAQNFWAVVCEASQKPVKLCFVKLSRLNEFPATAPHRGSAKTPQLFDCMSKSDGAVGYWRRVPSS